MLPSMPLLMTPVKQIKVENDDSQNSANRVPLTLTTRDLFVNTSETEQQTVNFLSIHSNKNASMPSAFSPSSVNPLGNNSANIQSSFSPSIIINPLGYCNASVQSKFSPTSVEVPSVNSKKYVSPRQAKSVSRHRPIDLSGKKNEKNEKQNQSSTCLHSLLMPVTTVDSELESPTYIAQDVEMTEVVAISDTEKSIVEVSQPVETLPLTPPHQSQKAEAKEGNSKGKISNSVSSRRSKKQRELEATIAALKPESTQVKNERATIYAHTYFMKVRERLEEAVYGEFVQMLVNFKDSNSTDAASLYSRMEILLSPHKDLIDEFLPFLLPDQAKQVGRLMDYLLLVKMKDFINKLEVLLTKHLQQVYASLEQLASQPNVTLTDVHNIILPHLKSSPLLTDYFLQLLPGERPPDSLMVDYEQADCIEGDEDMCYEMVQVPDYEDPYGGEHCPCKCHESQSLHCIKCGIKYINGRVYLQHGKIIRSAKVIFEKEDQEKMLELKWRGRGEPEIGYSRYHRRRYFPSPVKVDHSGSTKKSPRTPRAKSGNASKPRNLKSTSTKGSCSGKGLPLIEGIMPLANKSDVNDSSESEHKNNNDDKEKKNYGGSAISTGSQLMDDNQQHDSNKEIMRLTQELVEAVQKDSEGMDEDVVMNIKEETKSPTYSQFEDIPSVISPMSFYSESLHSDSGFELINKYNTSTSSQSENNNIKSNSLLISLFNPKSGEETKVEAMDISNTIENSSMNVSEVPKAVEIKGDEKIHFEVVKESQFDSATENCKFTFLDTEVKAVIKQEFNDSSNENPTTHSDIEDEHFSYMDVEIKEENITSEEEDSRNTDETVTKCRIFNLEHKGDSEIDVKTQKFSVVIKEEKNEGIAGKIESRKQPFVLEQKKGIESGSQVSEEKKANVDGKVAEQKKDSTAPEFPCWTREEDKIILQEFQQEGDSEQTYIKINKLLPSRTVEEIQNRFQVLLQLLQQMTGVADDTAR